MSFEIRSVADLVAQIRAARDSYQGAPWFRGQAESDWELLPGFMRAKSSVSETTLLSKFKQSAAMLTATVPKVSFEWIFLMQHYGVPTRLLDWSENPLVAAYFALENYLAHPGKDAAIWILFPTLLNKNANIVDQNETDYIPSFDDEEVQGYSTESVRQGTRLELFPIATIATRNNARIQAQSGTFTIHHNKRIAIEKVGSCDHVRKLVVPDSARAEFLDELRLLGVNRFSLFPEMASIGELLRESLK